jgi:pyridoxamine 5'-phosphate oxidase
VSKRKSDNKANPVGMNVSDLRRSLTPASLEREDLDDDPVVQFESWFRDACDADYVDPNALSLATVDEAGRPSSRTVLLKYFDDRGFVFFTNLESAKAVHIDKNANVALLFFWRELGRQVSIRGTAARIPTRETLKYFATRPRGSQIGAWVSAQSSVISSRSLLEAKFAELKRSFSDKEVPLPSFWGGYRVAPVEIEFWQGRKNRLHDRFLYKLQESGDWSVDRLAP